MADSWTNPILYPAPETPRFPKDFMKLPLVARDDVKESRRPFERSAPPGDIGGLKTPFEPLRLPKPIGDDSLGDIMLYD